MDNLVFFTLMLYPNPLFLRTSQDKWTDEFFFIIFPFCAKTHAHELQNWQKLTIYFLFLHSNLFLFSDMIWWIPVGPLYSWPSLLSSLWFRKAVRSRKHQNKITEIISLFNLLYVTHRLVINRRHLRREEPIWFQNTSLILFNQLWLVSSWLSECHFRDSRRSL